MVSIAITLIDPDFNGLDSLPARWGCDYQIDGFDFIYLNGLPALCLQLSPVQSIKINTFIQGCKSLDCGTDFPYLYVACFTYPVPPAIGSAWGNLWRVSECYLVLKESYYVPEIGFCMDWNWRLTLSKRRDSIGFLPIT